MWRITKETMKKLLSKFIGKYQSLAEAIVYVILGVIGAGCIYCIHTDHGVVVTVFAVIILAYCLYVASLADYVREQLIEKGEYGDQG